MALTRTLTQLIGLCQRRADKETDEHVDSDEWKELITEVYGEMHSIVSETGARYFETEADITANGSAQYALPTAHMSTVGVDRVTSSAGARVPLDELMVQERVVFGGVTGDARFWSFTGTNIRLYPTPSSGTYKHIYVPQPTDYSAASLSTDIDCINIWGLKFITWGVASIALHKGEANQIRALDEKKSAQGELVNWGVHRALTMPKRKIVNEIDLQIDQGIPLPGSRCWP